MHYAFEHDADGVKVILAGEFTFACNQTFKEILDKLDGETPSVVEFNMKDVGFIDSAGLGMLLLLRDRCNERNIRISLSEAQGQVEKIFHLSKFDQLFGTSHTEH